MLRNLTLLILLLSISNLFSQPEIFVSESNPKVDKSFDVISCTLDLDLYNCFISRYPYSYKAEEEIVIMFNVDDDDFFLNASNHSLVIDSVKGDVKTFSHLNDTLKITLNNCVQENDSVAVKIFFHHKDVEDGAFFVKDGMVFTNNAPKGARNWFPCYDHPSDKTLFELTAKTPGDVLLASNGILKDSIKIADTIYYNWKSDYPVATYLIAIAAKKNYQLKMDEWIDTFSDDTVEVRYYWNEGESEDNLDHIKKIMPEMMDFFTKLFGDYPFKKNAFATLNDQFIYGGMENQTIITLGPDSWDERLVSHEFAHSWFGNMITHKTWSDIWLNESFANYCEALWLEHTAGKDGYMSSIYKQLNRFFSERNPFPIYNPEWQKKIPPIGELYNSAIIYSKGALVLHMLRNIIGDDAFFASLKNYTTNENFKYANVVTNDFIKIVEERYGKNLDWFFEQWLLNPDYPAYNIFYDVSEKANEKWEVTILIQQQGKNFYKMPLDILFNFESDHRTETKTLMIDQVINFENNQVFTIVFEDEPVNILFDPEEKIILKTLMIDEVKTPDIYKLIEN